MSLLAKSVIKNKCWIVEKDGTKVATILANEYGVTYVAGETRENFASLKILSEKYNIIVDSSRNSSKKPQTGMLYGYPCSSKTFNELWNLPKKLPIYTKEEKSKSYFCAGYYLIKIDDEWTEQFCPKLITINRYEFCGPFKTKKEVEEYYGTIKLAS